MALLAWVKSKRMFIKIQEGTGDNLLNEDRVAGYVDYVLWSTFRPSELGIDEELEMELVDSGMIMSRHPLSCRGSLRTCVRDAFGLGAQACVLVEEEDS